MKKLIYIALILFVTILCPAQHITKRILRHAGDVWYDTLVPYSLKKVEIDTTGKFYNSIRGNLDKLSRDVYPEAYLWYIAASNDTIISAIEISSFSIKPEYPLFNYFVGVIDYKSHECQKYFILASDFSDKSVDFITDNFKITQDSLEVNYEVKVLPDSIFILTPDIYTRYDCMIIDSQLIELKFILNNQPLLIEGEKEKAMNFLYRRHIQ